MPSNEELSLISRIKDLERDFLSALALGSPITGILRSAEDVWEATRRALDVGLLDDDSRRRIHRLTVSIQTIAVNLGSLEEGQQRIGHQLLASAKDYLDQAGASTFLPQSCSLPSQQEPDPFYPLRLWFLDHFKNPYPDAKEKAHFQTMYPLHSKQQLDTWFTNIRRRSGWQDLKRRYTDGSAASFIKLCQECEKEGEGTMVVEEARKKIASIKLFLKEGVRETVREEIKEIVDKGAPVTTTKRTIAPRRRRQPVAVIAGGGKRTIPISQSSFDFAQLSSTVPSMPPSHAAARHPSSLHSLLSTSSSAEQTPSDWNSFRSSIVDSPSALEPLQLSPQPRYPSSFSSPTSSLRSVSNSSPSSFDSVISYDSTSSFASVSPSSPPASSSLISFDAPTPHSQPRQVGPPLSRRPSQRSAPVRQAQAPIDNPYFFTLNNTPLLPLPVEEADPVIATSSLAGFASNGDLIV